MISRRELLSAFAMSAAFPAVAFGQGSPAPRLSWSVFKSSPHYAPFRGAIATLRGNLNANDPNSWLFWANIHQFHCPHGRPYFLGWHRGYLTLFERKLQELSGLSDLRLPYWDYYADPVIPTEFTQGDAQSNPLYSPRTSTNVHSALSLQPFGATVTAFQRGAANAFEPQVEGRPHNPVHNLIGELMAGLQSPQDPIFWLHHGNIDRLWSAWVAAGEGRAMPSAGDPYWNDDFRYAQNLTMPRDATRDPSTSLGYVYGNSAMPTIIPQPAPARPPIKSLDQPSFRMPRPNFFAVGPSARLSLDERSFSVRIPVATSVRDRLSPLLQKSSRDAAAGAAPATSLSVVLDDVALTNEGARGGYFYKVYVNLPEAGPAPEERHLIGTLGPFEINAARHQAGHESDAGGPDPARLVLPATEVLRNLPRQALNQITVSFVRVDGDEAPDGVVINIESFRIEASAAPIE